MIWVLFVVIALLLICFCGVLLFGAPYLPTLTPQVKAALDLAALRPGETMLELGCGDGKVMIAAAKLGVHVVGYELNPFLALIAWLRTRRYGDKVSVVWGNFWTLDWPEADVIFTFLLARLMPRLDNQIQTTIVRPVRLVSFAFQIPHKTAVSEKQGIYLYRYRPTVAAKK